MPPKLTVEEKKALKVEKKAEKKRQLVERKKQLKRDQLNREIRYSNITLKRHEKDWRQMLIKIALPAMRNDLQYAWHNFERVMDCKDFTISLLMDEVRDAEEQYMNNYRNHFENIDRLIDFFNERLDGLADDNDMQISEMCQHYEEEVEQSKESFTEDDNYLKTILHILEVAKKVQKQNVRADYFSKLEEEDTKGSQIIHRLKGVLETVQQTIQNDVRGFLNTYKNQVKERKKQYDTLKVHDEALQKLLGNQLEKIRQALEEIKRLKQKLCDSQKMLGRKLKDLDGEHQFFNSAFNVLKKRLIQDRKVDEAKLNILTVNYNETLSFLEKLKERGEHVLHVAAVCRKLETHEEKILPFPENMKDINKVKLDDVDGFEESLGCFWQRLGQAEASRYAVNEELEFLKAENEILKMKLHRYCQCLNCPPVGYTFGGSKNITEGVLEQKKYDKHNYKQFHTRSDSSDEECC